MNGSFTVCVRDVHTIQSLARVRRTRAWIGLSLVATMAMPRVCQAQASVGFRSGFTEGNGIAPRGRVDVDYGTSVFDVGPTRGYTLGEVVAHVPVSRRFGFRLHVNSYSWIRTPVSRMAGYEDLGVGTSFIVREASGWRPTLALLTRLDVPSGNLPTQGSALRPTAKAALAWRLPAGLTLASNLGLASLADDQRRYGQRFGSLWLGRQVTRRIGSFAEAFAFDRESVTGSPTRYVRGGLTVLVTRAVHLDINAATQLQSGTARRAVGIGVKHRL